VIAMILAAGRGERLRPLTDTLPKALVEVRGRSLLERHLDRLHEAGINDAVINLGWLGEKIVERVGSGSRYGLNVVYSPEGDNVLDTGGGIHNALPMLGHDTFLVVNADIFTDMPVPDFDLPAELHGHLVLVPTPDYREAGDFDLQDDLVQNGDLRPLTFSGMAVYRPEFFADCRPGRFPLVPMLRDAADAGQLGGSLYEGRWADIGTRQRLDAINDQELV
jgi:MurNAc alpha-1-phosphate uridylyltransferase